MKICPDCQKETVQVSFDGIAFFCYCSNCYDADCGGDPPRYFSNSRKGYGFFKEDAVEAFFEER